MRLSTRLLYLSLAAALAGPPLALASRAEAFEGQLIDRRTDRPIADAGVAVLGLTGLVRSDLDGRFAWTPDPPPPFVLLVVLPDGRLARPIRIDAPSGASPMIVSVDAAVQDAIVVSGSSPSVDAPPGASTTLLSSAEVSWRAPANVMQALENVIGVSSVAEGQNAVPAVRGLARGRTLVLLDGGRLFSERRAGPSVSFIAPDSLDRIEIVRGPSSVAYGSDAFGGVISLVTRQPPAAAPLAGRFTATAGAGVPSRRSDAEISIGLGGRGAVRAAGRHRDASAYSSPDGVVPNSAWHDDGALVRIAVRAAGHWTAGWRGDFVGASGLPRSDSATLLVSNPFERSKRGTASFDRSGVPWLDHLSVSGVVGSYAQRLDQDRLPAPGRPRRIDRADIEGTDVQLRAVARTGLAAGRVLTTGIDVNERHDLTAHDIALVFNASGALTSVTDSASIASARRIDAGTFAQIDVPLGAAITLTAGGRVDQVRSVNAGGYFGDRRVSHTASSGSAAITARPAAHVTVAAQVSSGFHDPTLSDRFYRGPVGRGVIIGNPDLDPERSVQLDVNARYDRGRWRVGASFYHYDISHLIERYQSGPDTFLFRNRGLAQVRGVEVEARVEMGAGVVIDVAAQAGRGRAKDDGAALDDVAPRSIVLQARRAFGARVFASARLAAIARDAGPGPSEVTVPGYVDAGAAAGWRASRWLEVRAGVSNLFDQRYYSSPSPRGVLAAGRSGTITASLTF